MKQQILDNIDNAEKLEQLYRQDHQEFEKHFSVLAQSHSSDLVNFWKIRLEPEKSSARMAIRIPDLIEMIVIAAVTAIPVLLPALFSGIDRESFYLRNVPLIAFAGLMIYSFRINRPGGMKKSLSYAAALAVTGLYVNLLPGGPSDSVLIAILHVPLMLWCLFGLTWIQFDYRNMASRMEFIRYNGELVIMTGLILLAGGVLTGITQGLFQVIGMNIMDVYAFFIAIPGAVAAPVVAWFLIRSFSGITSKIAPVIARVFTPVVLVTLSVYLGSLLFTKNSILENRELLIIFNVMLLGVLALIIFSVAGMNHENPGRNNLTALFLLSVLAIVINAIALFAIVSRVSEGLTPNRTAVLVTNLLVFINLILIALRLYQTRFKGEPVEVIEKSVAGYLTIYGAWTLIAMLIFPLVFGYL